MKDQLEGEIGKVGDVQLRGVLKKMRHEYKDRTSPVSIAAALTTVGVWLLIAAGLVFLATKFGNTVAQWFLHLSGGFTKLGVISVFVAGISLLSVPAAYGFGRGRRGA